jgi:hypothetical protein
VGAPVARKASSCPAAQRFLLADNWVAIDQPAANRDPNFNGGADREYRQLFARTSTWHRLRREDA